MTAPPVFPHGAGRGPEGTPRCCRTRSARRAELSEEFDEERHGEPAASPEAQAIAHAERERLQDALEQLPTRFREVLVLRELEGCSYKEIAEITAVPLGTVMSSLARARRR